MKVIDAEISIREALSTGGEKFKELGLLAEGYVLFCDAKYMQCAPEESKYMTAVLAIKTDDGKETATVIIDEDAETEDAYIESSDEDIEDDENEDDDEDLTDELDEDDESDSHIYEIDFGFDVKNGEIADSDVESAILTFLEDCDEIKEKLEESDDIGATLDELRSVEEAQYAELLKKLKKIRIGFLVAAGVMALVVILALIL